MSKIQTSTIEIQTPVGLAAGYLATPAGEATHPGVIVVHEWWGLNEHTQDITRRLASAGYAALAPDLYGGIVATDAKQAGTLMSELRTENAIAILEAAVDALPRNGPPRPVGALGFCMGGGLALWLGCKTMHVGAVAAFYGDPPPDDELARLQASVLFVAAETDPWINAEKVDRLDAALQNHHKEHQVLRFKGTQHAFFNDTRPDVYHEQAAKKAWKAVLDFFHKHLDVPHAPI